LGAMQPQERAEASDRPCLGKFPVMRLYPNPRYLLHGFLVLGFEVGLHADDSCDCAVPLAVGQPRLPHPTQPDGWDVVSVLHEPASLTTSALGTTARPGTGELTVTGFNPTVLARAVEVVTSALQDFSAT
jgi:hypothetical protein